MIPRAKHFLAQIRLRRNDTDRTLIVTIADERGSILTLGRSRDHGGHVSLMHSHDADELEREVRLIVAMALHIEDRRVRPEEIWTVINAELQRRELGNVPN